MLITSTAMATKNTEPTDGINIIDGHKLIARAANLTVSEEVMPFQFAAVAQTSINAINIMKAEEEAKKKKEAEEKAAREKAEAEAKAKAEAEAAAAAAAEEAAAAEKAAAKAAAKAAKAAEGSSETKKATTTAPKKNTGVLTASKGVNWFNGVKETYYSSRVLYHYMTPQWKAGSDGVWRDKEGYIIVASSSLKYGATGECSLGPFKVYDYCPGHNGIDIYVNW